LWGLLLSVPGWLHDEHSIITLTSFQVNREVRLNLTHQSAPRRFFNLFQPWIVLLDNQPAVSPSGFSAFKLLVRKTLVLF
ncbi:MAG: hypothetical protein ACQETH_06820, partial [Candidatus Rifleibacteriota bacterium]